MGIAKSQESSTANSTSPSKKSEYSIAMSTFEVNPYATNEAFPYPLQDLEIISPSVKEKGKDKNIDVEGIIKITPKNKTQ